MVAALLALLVAWQGLIAPYTNLFRVQSPPGQVVGVQHPAQVRLGDQAVFLGYDLETQQVTPGQTLLVRVYWQATASLKTNYRSFVHLDALPDLTTVAQSDAMHPAGIPMTTWPPSMYGRDEHELALPSGLPPGVYLLRAGLYDPETGRRLSALDERGQEAGDAVLLQGLRVEPAVPLRAETLPQHPVTVFGDQIELVSYSVGDARDPTVTLYWRARQSITTDYSVFVHVLDEAGQVVAQSDGAPAGGRNPTTYWLPGEIVADAHHAVLPMGASGPYHIAVGLYEQGTLTRVEAKDDQGRALPDNRVVLQASVQ